MQDWTPEGIEKKLRQLSKQICCLETNSSGGDISSVFGRTGAVVAVSGDYDFSEIGATPTTLLGYGITDAQPLDGDLTAIAALAGTTGLLAKTALNTWTLDTSTYLTSVRISDLVAANTIHTINNGASLQEWQWNTLAGTSALKLSSTSTAAASNLQTVFEIALSGTNGTTTQTTTGALISNTHTGTLSTNIAIQAIASGGATNNYALYTGTASTNNGAIFVNGSITTAASFGNISTGASTSVTIAQGNGAVNCSSVSNVGLVNGDISIIPLQDVVFRPGNVEKGRFRTNGRINIAAPTVPSTASDTGVTGDVAWDTGFIYVCTATNTWKRVAIATF